LDALALYAARSKQNRIVGSPDDVSRAIVG
jgi:hypothetical protein